MRRFVITGEAALAVVAVALVAGADGFEVSPWAVICAVAAVAAGILVHMRRGVRWSVPHGWAMAVVGWMALSSVVNQVAPADAARVIATAFMGVVLALLATGPAGRAWASVAVAVVGCAAAASLVAGRLAGTPRPPGLLGSPILSASVVLLALAVVPVLRAAPWVRVAVAVLAAGGIAASGSRGAMLAALAAAMVALVRAGTRWLRIATLAVAVVAGAGLAARLATDRDPLRFERVRIWQTALDTAVSEMPLGCGPSGYEDAALPHNFPREGEFARFARIPRIAESDFIQVIATLGLPGCLLLGVVVVSALRARRRGGPAAAMVAAVVVTMGLVNTTFVHPIVVATTVLAFCAAVPLVWRRVPAVRAVPSLAVVAPLATLLAVALIVPPGWMGGSPALLVEPARAVLLTGTDRDGELADAEMLASRAAVLRPRWGTAWRTLGAIRLRRGVLRSEEPLVEAAANAYASSRALDANDAWAALGEGRALRSLGRRQAARAAVRSAVRLEPNLAAGWYELAVIELEDGRLAAAQGALAGLDRAVVAAAGAAMVSDYELALARIDPEAIPRLRAALGGPR